jgi:hypothetical protein
MEERTAVDLIGWIVGFPILGCLIGGIVLYQAATIAQPRTIGFWLANGFALVLSLFAVVFPPIAAFREIRRRKLNATEPDEVNGSEP